MCFNLNSQMVQHLHTIGLRVENPNFYFLIRSLLNAEIRLLIVTFKSLSDKFQKKTTVFCVSEDIRL